MAVRKRTQKHTEDEHLPNGSIIRWSRRRDRYVPVICGSCGQERLIERIGATRETFTGICHSCTNGKKLQDEILPSGSVIFWSRRNKERVPVKCGNCGCERIVHAATFRKETYTGLCLSCVNTGSGSNAWRGGRISDGHGYIRVKVYPDHPFYATMATAAGYILEHRLVMAEHLGRPLENNEIVHHKNGNKTDNRIENLELFVSFQEHGKAAQQRHPHPGHEPTETLRQTFLDRLKRLFDSDK
ncbi:MAG: HNH endonuclease signature motif containing protein [Chloroflexota bacterium]